MANQDNPIFDTLNRKLGLNDTPKSFQEKYNIFRESLIDFGEVVPDDPEEVVFRKMSKGSALSSKTQRFTGRQAAQSLIDTLEKKWT